jgi:hypothetical protein
MRRLDERHHTPVRTFAALALVLVASVAPGNAAADDKGPDADTIVARAVEADPWGLAGAEVSARVTVTEKSGRTRALAFDAKSRRQAAPLSKSVITFRAPADVAGMKFLQIQHKDSDDERFLYTPELKRSRRIAGSTRGESFMGTDFSYADLDGRDLRAGKATRRADEVVAKLDCYHLDVVPQSSDSVYGRIELWVRKDNFVPIKWAMFDKRSALLKTLVARELVRKGDRWFITSSRMTDGASGRTTELVLDRIDRRDDIPAEAFSVRAIEQG